MEAACRVFAGELAMAVAAEGGGAVRIPSGAVCRFICLAGALTEVVGDRKGILEARVADPTGAFRLITGRGDDEVNEALGAIAPPAFVLAWGEAVFRMTPGGGDLVIQPDSVVAIDREARDAWVLRTAVLTIERLKERHAAAPESADTLRQLASMVGRALETVQPAVHCDPTRVRQTVEELVGRAAGRQGMPVEELYRQCAGGGIRRDEVDAAIRQLFEDGDCYFPQKGLIKLL
jgi:RPA family protein